MSSVVIASARRESRPRGLGRSQNGFGSSSRAPGPTNNGRGGARPRETADEHTTTRRRAPRTAAHGRGRHRVGLTAGEGRSLARLDLLERASMGKRGRDDDAGGASGATALAAPADDRVRLYHAHRQHLNKLFLADIDRKIKEDPSRILDAEVASYVKHSKSLRVRPLSRALPFPSFRAFGRDRAGSRNPHDLERFPPIRPPLDLSTSPRTFPDLSLPPSPRPTTDDVRGRHSSSTALVVALVAAGARVAAGVCVWHGRRRPARPRRPTSSSSAPAAPSHHPVLPPRAQGRVRGYAHDRHRRGRSGVLLGRQRRGRPGRKAAKDEAGAESTPGLVKMPPAPPPSTSAPATRRRRRHERRLRARVGNVPHEQRPVGLLARDADRALA